MGPHSSILAWRILWTEEMGGLWSIELLSQTRLKQLSKHAYTSLVIRLKNPALGKRKLKAPVYMLLNS